MYFWADKTYTPLIFVLIIWASWIVPIVIGIVSWGRRDRSGNWGKEWTMVAFGSFLFITQGVIYIFQFITGTLRTDPFRPWVVYYAVPSDPIYYVSAMVTFVIEFTCVWNIVFSWTYWTGIFILALVPPLGVYIFEFNTPVEIVISGASGVLVTTLFIIALRLYMIYELPMWLNCPPWTWLGCVDTWIMDEKGHEEAKMIKEMLADPPRGSGASPEARLQQQSRWLSSQC